MQEIEIHVSTFTHAHNLLMNLPVVVIPVAKAVYSFQPECDSPLATP